MTRRGRGGRKTTYISSLPMRSLAKLLRAIFFTFASIGFLYDVMLLGAQPPWRVAVAVVFSGMIGAAWAYVFTRNLKLLPVLIVGHMVLAAFVFRPSVGFPIPEAGALRLRLTVASLGTLACMVTGYILFIRFIGTEGKQHLRLQTEVDLAREVHRVLVPPISLRTDELEFYGRSIPSSEVGGDLLDLVTDSGRPICLVADVSGHGVSAGILMGMFKTAARMRLAAAGGLGGALTDVNQTILGLKKPEMFVTVACMRFEGEGSAELALAGHLPVLHFRKGTRTVDSLGPPEFPLGLFEGHTYVSSRVRYGSGDLFVFLTDGLTEVFDEREEEFGSGRIGELVRDNLEAPLEKIFDVVVTAIARHGKQLDDQTLLLVRAV